MNLFIKFGHWLESRSRVSMEEFDGRIGGVWDEINKIKDEIKLSPSTAKEFAIINARLNRLELLVGLKREPEAVKVPDTPRIR
jgi:hypothetical protein